MEDSLGLLEPRSRLIGLRIVLILVVMEDSLGPIIHRIKADCD